MDAIEKRGFDSDLAFFVIQESPNSLERFENGGRVLYKLGKGRLMGPGHPAGNQQYYQQLSFFKQSALQRLFPVFVIRQDGSRFFAGQYEYDSIKKKESFEGFTYFLIKLLRRVRPKD